jgi:hypothetical protein
MEDADFSDDFCRFIQVHVPSVPAAEALIALWRERGAAEPGMEGYVRTLAQAYEERPVTLIRLIYALRDSKIRSFADAFKLRKD